jgi:hypothetical protein
MKVDVINALAQTTSRVKATVARVFAFSVLPTCLEHDFIRCQNTPSYAFTTTSDYVDINHVVALQKGQANGRLNIHTAQSYPKKNLPTTTFSPALQRPR